jgi:DEAD/DEAH box helicase domain-containing protein
MDAVVDEKAVLDTIPYSRVFYHAFPGAIIMHRGRKYKVLSMTRPPPFAASGTGYRGKCSLAAFAKPTTVRYSTRPLSTLKITIVKQMERIESSCGPLKLHPVAETVPAAPDDFVGSSDGSLAGNGVVTVKRSVHGYKKLSPVTRAEIARTEISLPSMEFDTYALWIDTEAATLASVVSDYDAGVHALSHALLAVASLFVPCASSDLECDHNYIECTRIMLFDLRAGGTGTCAQLWKCIFKPNGLLDAAIDLLENCPSCSSDSDYDGGCPACLQSGHCIKFNQNLSRTAALVIAKRMLNRVKQTTLYKQNCAAAGENEDKQTGESRQNSVTFSSPRRAKRATALRDANNLKSARGRQIVVGRPSWPLDEMDMARQEMAD